MAAATQADGRGSNVTVEEGGRQREFGPADLPISLGAGSDADVVLDGVQGSIQIGRLDEVFFVQPGRSARNVRVDGAPLSGTRGLRDGDVIAFDRARLECRVTGHTLAIRIDWIVTAGDTAPPDLDELARGGRTAEIAITPIAFKPGAAAGVRAGRNGWSKGQIGAATAFVVLATVAWFAFTAKSVALDIEPPPAAMSLPSTLFKLKIGDRFLLRSGSHRVEAELPGYYPLATEIEVGSVSDQTIALTLTKLPGLVTITTQPEVAAEVSRDGTVLGATPLVDTELTPGVHRLEFSAARHLTEVRELEVRGGGERQSLAATLTPDYALVSLRTDPPGATVLVDGVAAGVTPAELEVDSGEHELEVRLAGYNAWSDKILVAANTPQQLPDLKLTAADGRLELASTPSEASVSVDGEFRGRTPLSLRLSPGRAHRVTLTKPGYETAARELSVAADSGRRLQVELAPQLGQIEVVSIPPDAEVFVGGERRGATPTTLELTSVSHAIEIRKTGFAAERAELTPRPGYPQKLERTLVPLNESSGGGFASQLRTVEKQELKLVPAGQFTMGSSRREIGRRSNEMLRPVRVTRAFYLGTHEVTNAQFRAFKPDHDSGEFDGQSLNGDDQPATNVSWEEAAQYLNWLSVKDGLQPVYEPQANGWAALRPLRNGYRLPSEAEWEWAARFAGQEMGLHYPWGAELPPPDRSGNYADVTAASILPSTLVTYNDGAPVTAAVGRYAANAYGIFDLGGNVAEWVQDFYAPDVIETTERVDDPLGPETGRVYVIRGASWRSATVTDLRLAARSSGFEGRDDVGFRIARNLLK
jgi:formylglycine-generating enzyme required for sulfatase activity